MASSSVSQQSDGLASSSDSSDESDQQFPRRIIVLDSYRQGGVFYICRNRHHLEATDPSHIVLLQDDTPMSVVNRRSHRHINRYNLSFWGFRVKLSRDVFFLTTDFIKYRFAMMDGDVADLKHPEALDPWNALASKRPSHAMLDVRNTLVVLQEVLGGDSAFHPSRRCGKCRKNRCAHCNVSGWGVPEFFRIFGIFSESAEPTLQQLTILIPGSPDDILGHFEYDDLECAPFLVSQSNCRRTITGLANSQEQASQLNRVIDMWVELQNRQPTVGSNGYQLPSIEFARRSRP